MMKTVLSALGDLPARELVDRLRSAVGEERHATANVIALLMEVDARRLYLAEGFSSLFTYCTMSLHLSEHAAYNRIEAARAARRFPFILDLIEAGSVTLTTIRLMAPHLTDANHREVLDRARHKSKRDVEALVATLSPAPDAPSVVRKLPTMRVSKPTESPRASDAEKCDFGLLAQSSTYVSTPPRQAEVQPLGPERYKIQVTVNRETYEKFRRAQDLLRHVVPNGDPAIIVERALDLLVAHLGRTKLCMTKNPRASGSVSSGRHIPANVKRIVWHRDGGRCAFRGSQGRCSEKPQP